MDICPKSMLLPVFPDADGTIASHVIRHFSSEIENVGEAFVTHGKVECCYDMPCFNAKQVLNLWLTFPDEISHT
jgi:peroxiredoxin